MTEITTEPQRQPKPEGGDLAALREEAKGLGIDPTGLSRQGLAASIAAVRQAVANLPAAQPAEREDELRTDELGEDLGPANTRRIPMGTRTQRLLAEPRPGFYRRWINDVPGRIERARRAGYAHVKDRTGAPISTPAGTQEHGGGMRAYLMELPDPLRQEDLVAKARVNDEIDDAVNRGKNDDQPDDRRYVPEQGIRINRPSRRH
jgi:hypothetical protein